MYIPVVFSSLLKPVILKFDTRVPFFRQAWIRMNGKFLYYFIVHPSEFFRLSNGGSALRLTNPRRHFSSVKD